MYRGYNYGRCYLVHYGVKGQKKGVRRYQNEDGSLTTEGYAHYGRNPPGAKRRKKVSFKQFIKKLFNHKSDPKKELNKRVDQASDEELRSRTSRLKLEGDYYRAKADRRDAIIRSREKKMSEGKKFFLDHMWKFSESVVNTWIKANKPEKSGKSGKSGKPEKKEEDED